MLTYSGTTPASVRRALDVGREQVVCVILKSQGDDLAFVDSANE